MSVLVYNVRTDTRPWGQLPHAALRGCGADMSHQAQQVHGLITPLLGHICSLTLEHHISLLYMLALDIMCPVPSPTT